MPDAVTMLELRHYTKEDDTLKLLMVDIKRGKLSQGLKGSRFKECFQELSSSDGLVLRGEKIVIPKELRPGVLSAAHEGHPGIVGMLRQLRQSVWWPGMTKDAHIYAMKGACQLLPRTVLLQ